VWAFVLLVTLLFGADFARAERSFFLSGEFAGRSVLRSSSFEDWEISASYAEGSAMLSVYARCRTPACNFEVWSFSFAPPFGEPLAVGVYEGAGDFVLPDKPQLGVSAPPPSECTPQSGRFEIREFVRDAFFGFYDFPASVDFEVRCRNDVLTGAVRIRSGDPACASGAAGVTCDDLDPCTSSDRCVLGECAGTRDVSCNPLTCDDGDPCTDDRREGNTCTHTAIPGSCWLIDDATVRATSSASADGRSASCSLRCRSASDGVLALLDDGTYVTPGSTQTEGCVVQTTTPTEVGRIKIGRRGALILTPDNLSEQEEALSRCIGRPLVVKDMRTRLRIAEDGTFLTGVSKLRFRVRGAVPVDGRQVVRFRATPRSPSAATVTAGARRRALPTCSQDLRPKCIVH